MLESKCEDAFKYVNDSKEKATYDLIVMDINYQEEDKSISPPWKFLEAEFMTKLASLAADGTSYLALNILYYDEEAKQRAHKLMQQVPGFSSVALFEAEESTNKVFLLSRDPNVTDLKSMLPADAIKQFEEMLKGWNINKGSWMKEMRMNEHIKQIKYL